MTTPSARRTPKRPSDWKPTFVFVTPRTWYGKDAWVAERKAEGAWKDVRVIHGPDLEAWLESSSTTELWLAERLGRADREGETAVAWFDRWANAAEPAIPSSLIVAGREREAELVLGNLRRDGLRALSVVGDDRGEAIAFLIAALREADATDLLDRIVVPRAQQSDSFPRWSPADRDRRHRGGALGATKPLRGGRGPRVSSRTLARRADVNLPHVPAERITDTLRNMGLGEDAARRHTRECGSSLTVLRRRLSTTRRFERRPGHVATLQAPFFRLSWRGRGARGLTPT